MVSLRSLRTLAFTSAVTCSGSGYASSTNKARILIVSDKITLSYLGTSWLINWHELLILQELHTWKSTTCKREISSMCWEQILLLKVPNWKLHTFSSGKLKKARNLFDAKTVLRSTDGQPNNATFFKSLPDNHLQWQAKGSTTDESSDL